MTLLLGALSPDMVCLEVERVAADTAGQGAGTCQRFIGWTRMQRIGGLNEQPNSDSDPAGSPSEGDGASTKTHTESGFG